MKCESPRRRLKVKGGRNEFGFGKLIKPWLEMSSVSDDYKKLIMSYLAPELRALLAAVGESKTGNKRELQNRCIDIFKSGKRRPQLLMKVQEMSNLGSSSVVGSRSSQRSRPGPAADISNLVDKNGGSVAVVAAPPGSGGTAPVTATAAANLASPTLASPGTAGAGRGSSLRPPPPKRTVNGQVVVRASHHGLRQRALVPTRSVPSVGIDNGQGHPWNALPPLVPVVKMREHPFIQVASELIPLSCLNDVAQSTLKMSEEGFMIKMATFPIPISQLQLANSQAAANYVLLRFCDLGSTSSTPGELDDQFPPSLRVSVNGIHIPMVIKSPPIPGTKVRITPKPVDISSHIHPNFQNRIGVIWGDNGIDKYALSVYAGTRQLSMHLLSRVCQKGELPVKFTMDIVQRFTSRDEDAQGEVCAPPSIQVYVICPVGKTRMRYPCRGLPCEHLQCFDAENFLLMNEKRCKFTCPICNIPLKFDELRLDKFFSKILEELTPDAGEKINVFYDGRWEPVVEVKRKKNVGDVGLGAGPPPPLKRAKVEDGKDGATVDDEDVVIVEPDDDEKVVLAPVLPVQDKFCTSGSNNNNSGTTKEPEFIDLD